MGRFLADISSRLWGFSRAQQHVCSKGYQCLVLLAGSNGRRDGPEVTQGGPLVLRDVQADVTLRVCTGVVAEREERHRGCTGRVPPPPRGRCRQGDGTLRARL